MLIDTEQLKEWLRRIPFHDLSDGKGLCSVCFKDDFSKAIKELDKSNAIVDAVQVVRCKDCKHAEIYEFGCGEYHLACVDKDDTGFVDFAEFVDGNDFCNKGKRR